MQRFHPFSLLTRHVRLPLPAPAIRRRERYILPALIELKLVAILRPVQPSEVVAAVVGVDILAGLVPESAFPALRTRKNIPHQALAAPQVGLRARTVSHRRRNQVPAAANPVAVAAVDELVGAAREAALGRVLQRRETRHQRRQIQILGDSLGRRTDDGEARQPAERVRAVRLVARGGGNPAVERLARAHPLGQPRHEGVEAGGARGRVARQLHW